MDLIENIIAALLNLLLWGTFFAAYIGWCEWSDRRKYPKK